MADQKISQLSAATTPLAGSEVLPIVQSGATVKASVANIQAAPVAAGVANGVVYLNASKVPTSTESLTFDGTTLNNETGSGVFSSRDNITVKAVAGGTNSTVVDINSAGTVGITKFSINNTERGRIDRFGNLIQTVNTTAATLATNGTLTFSIVDNSTLRISVRGSDGTTRTATVALT
jgi:hypothetical protein